MAEESRNFQVEIITPERIFYTGEASMIEFTSVEGEMGVYKNHIPLTTVLAPGIVTITEDGGQKKAAVHAGFAEILGDKVHDSRGAGTSQGTGADQSEIVQRCRMERFIRHFC